MKSSLWKPIYISFIILTGAFAVMEFIDGNLSSAAMWLFFCMVILIVYQGFYLKRAKGLEKEEALESLLEPETVQKMEQGTLIPLHTDGVNLEPGEVCYWYDNAQQNYYDGKKGILYLTDERLLFPCEDFSFDIPVAILEVKKDRKGFTANANGKKMPFVTGSTDAFLTVFDIIKHHQLPSEDEENS